MDYQQFVSMSKPVPNLYRNSGIVKCRGSRKKEHDEAAGGRRRQDLRVRPCLSGTTVNEFKFDTELFNVIEVVKQINDNFIATVVLNQHKKVLVLMDQHAVHERIRYENLLKDYTSRNQKFFISVELDIPILVNDLPKRRCEWLLENSEKVKRCGIRLKAERIGHLLITSIPKCFDRKKFNQGRADLERTVQKLLIEMTKDFDCNYMTNTTIPMTIHHAIATEACHGAIKFGERLNMDQCTKLVKSLMHTKAPSRCAHGRPSVIPLLELNYPDDCQIPVTQKKLNFASLKRLRVATKRKINIQPNNPTKKKQ